MPSEQATTLAIILNELIANAIEHGFEGRERGEIRITGAREDHHILLRVADDGQGVTEGFVFQNAEGLGLQLVRSLAQSNLHGSVRMHTAAGNPDLADAQASPRLTDPILPAITPDTSLAKAEKPAARDERTWTIVELRFPIATEATSHTETVLLAGESA